MYQYNDVGQSMIKSQVAPMVTGGEFTDNHPLSLAPASPNKAHAVPRTSLDRLEV
jgi:hypothetical protein